MMEKEKIMKTNYFEDVNPEFLKEEFSLEDRKDPDGASRKLRDDFSEIFLSELPGHKVVMKSGDNSFYLMNKEDGKQEFKLSLDYIGPSIYQASDIGGLTVKEIKEFLKVSRTLGGHIAWEIGLGTKWTVNIVRGGRIFPRSNYGFFDRTDWTFLLLKIYMETESGEEYEEKILALGQFTRNYTQTTKRGLLTTNKG